MTSVAALAVGAIVGIISGLTGIGGGVLMVPFLYALYARLGVLRGDATLLAHATSLAVIVPAALRGLRGYRGTGLVHWRAAVPLAVMGGLSAALTARLAPAVPAQGLRAAFGVFLIVISADLLLRRGTPTGPLPDDRAHVIGAALLGIPIGALSALLGVGGGVPATMAMMYVLRMPFEALAPTSLLVITGTSLAGSASYLTSATPALPFGAVVGLVDLGHGLPLAVGAVACAPLGVRLNRAMPVLLLRRVFGVLLLLIGTSVVWRSL